jgi:hypothetical protein
MLKATLKTGLALALAVGLLVVGTALLPADDKDKPDDADPPKVITENKNTLIKKHKDKIEIEASSSYQGWEPEKLIDDNLDTSWFSDSNDSAAKGTKPSITIKFPEDVTVNRVSIAGNREPDYPDNFSILSGTVEFFDADGKSLGKEERDAKGKRFDFEFKPKEALKKVRSIKFISVKDQGDQNDFGDIAIGEFLIE